MSNRYALILISFFFFNAVTQNTDAQQNLHTISTEWQTRAERTSYRETARYEETISYSRKLADASAQITYQEFGHSGEGRALPLLIADRDGDHSPAAVKRKGNAVVLIQACIHAGESDGKDAGFELLRDFAIAKTLPHLLDHVTILFIPIYNTDGHERFGPYNRINQNGPTEMGWRATTAYLNLNRDYMKADAPETRAWLKLWNEWGPDLFIDCHVTDGADFRYNVTYQFEQFENVAPQVRNWLAQTMTKVVPATEGAGNLLSTYLEFKDNRDFSQGIQTFISTPRFSTGYTPMRNRPGLLIETHMFKDYGWRVRGTYDLLRFMIEEVNKDPNSLLKAVHEADQATIREGQKYNAQQRVPLLMELTEKTEPFLLKAVRSHTEMSDISGDLRVVFEDQPVDLTVPIYKETRAARSVVPPLYYIIPPQWRSVIETVNAHGLISERTQKPLTLEVETYRFNDAHWAGEPFEGRLMVTAHAVPIRVQRTYPENSLIVPLAQPAARVAIHLLEPEAPDSLLRWGFFNAIFEQKEYGENYVVEKLAREMLAKDNKLKLEFEKRLAEDPQFAASPTARLNFFYERSPYWDQEKNIYPVGRITEKINRLVKEKPKPKIKPK